MDPEDAKFLRTDRRPGTLDVHPTLNAIVLNYELEVQILGDNENIIYGEKHSMKKIIELPMLNTRTDCHALARELLSQCDLIHPSRLAEVEQTIYYLKKRKNVQNTIKDINNVIKNSSETNGANINNLNEYIELLYEELPEKIKAASYILQLAKDPENLESLSKNETILSALARVLREDWKRSIVLSTNLIFTFFCFSTYSCFHHVILSYKIGSLCMEIIDYELRRYDDWKAVTEGGKPPSEPSLIRRTCPSSASMTEIHKSRIPEPVRPKSGHFGDIAKSGLEGSIYDDLSTSTDNLDDKKQLTEEEKIKRYRTLIRKQEQLLRVAFYLLLNIAENENVEEKMSKKNIIGLLAKALDRENEELLVLVVSFLKKLSVMNNNVYQMSELHVLEKLAKLLKSNNSDLIHLILKLLFNLSFDGELRAQMVSLGFLPKFVSLLTDDKQQETVMKLLYHLSYDNDVKTQFAYTDCVSLIFDMLELSVTEEVDQVMLALCINLSMNPQNAQLMVDNNGLQSLMTRAFRYQDALLMKMIRNISEHESLKPNFIEFVGDLAKAVIESKKEDFIIECLGVLSNLNLPDLDWAEIFKHFDMITWFKNVVKRNNVEPDFVLEIIVLLGTAAYDESCAQLICNSDLLQLLIELLKFHQEDDEIVLQIIYVFLVILAHESTVQYVINKTEAPAYLIDLLQDNNKNIRKVCNTCLNMIMDNSTSWAERIRIERFRHHNEQWLQMVDNHQFDEEEEQEKEIEPVFMNTGYISSNIVTSLADLDAMPKTPKKSEVLSTTENDYFERPETSLLQDFEIESLDGSI
ncbi:kinesin-associated protein 3 isoform X2 [Agrilus planipennis]|nr:kinesin-associated protein 3 isoform X2 [Agrilus planipennis]